MIESPHTPPTPKIFISYAREDARDIAIRLRDDLVAAGHDTWLDLSEIAAGASWSRDIELAIEAADLVLALLSQGSYVSDICRAEQLRALRKGKRIVPILVQPDADRPLHLENLNYIDLSDVTGYGAAFRDLLTVIATGHIPRPTTRITDTTTIPLPKTLATFTAQVPELKRDARAFRRYLADLRDEPWLGARYWWPYYTFYFADVHDIAAALEAGVVLPPANQPNPPIRRTRWDHTVRLYFRPRTPDLFASEGIRPARTRSGGHVPIPVYLLFDLDALLNHPETRFTEGDVTLDGKTYKAASAFRDLPFDVIYHDSWFRAEERDEVMYARRAQVIVPGALSLDHLRHVWCRSSAEAETLRALLSADAWQRWRDKVTTRADHNLFNRRWVYVDEVTLLPNEARFRFSPCDGEDCGGFTARVEVISGEEKGDRYSVEIPDLTGDDDLSVDLSAIDGDYDLRLYLDESLAYAGRFVYGDDVY
jgi:hypothetical protein